MKEIPASLAAVFEWIDAHQQEAIADLQILVQQPSISAQGIGLHECALLVQQLMHRDGLPADLHQLQGGAPPVVMGHIPSTHNPKNMLAYAHYDVQPPEPLDKWVYPPFSATIADGRLWGRGATDNKSGLLAFVKAAKAWLQTGWSAPCRGKIHVRRGGRNRFRQPGAICGSQSRTVPGGCHALPGWRPQPQRKCTRN